MMQLASHNFRSPRHTTHYCEVGPADGPLMIFLHGWPQIGLIWRAQIEAFASEGWRCVAPDMRGYGSSSAPTASNDYALEELVGDMVELHDHLGARPAIWVGHDWGSPSPVRCQRCIRRGAGASCLSQSRIFPMGSRYLTFSR